MEGGYAFEGCCFWHLKGALASTHKNHVQGRLKGLSPRKLQARGGTPHCDLPHEEVCDDSTPFSSTLT